MKRFLIFTLILSNVSLAQVCPDLAGDYHCLLNPNQYSRLRIAQVQTTEEITTYTFDYLAIPGEPEQIPASSSGESGEMGWYTKCKDGRLLSIPGGYENMLSEIYLDKNKALTRALNGRVVQSCPRAQ